MFKQLLFFYNIHSSNSPEKKNPSVKCSFHKILTVFNIDNKKCFLSSESELFLKDHVTLKTGVMMTKIQLYIHYRNTLHFKIYSNRKNFFLLYRLYFFLNCGTILKQYCLYCIFLLNICSLEHKRLEHERYNAIQNETKTFRNLNEPKHFNNSAYLLILNKY